MALSTHSKFYYGYKITTANRFLDFQEGLNVRVATITVGSYTGSTLAIEITKQLNAVGTNDYSCSYDRVTRKFTISADANFDLLTQSGNNFGQAVWPMIGFNAPDKTGTLTYLADVLSGKEYSTQFYIQSYKPTSLNRKAIDGVINKSASGVIEVVKFGNERFMSGELNFITNIIQAQGSIIRTNPDGVANFIEFIEWCTEKGPVEFMPNEADVLTFQAFILESTEVDSKGLDYDLVEIYDRGLAGYFRSGNLKFKLIS
jgi:hypothetical protein